MATLESRLDALEKALFTRDQSQGEDWEAYCRTLEARNKDLQMKNDALQKSIERYELNSQNERSITVPIETSDTDYQSALARVDVFRRDFINLKQRLDDSEALELHFRQKYQQQQETDMLTTAELDRAKRDLQISEDKQAALEQQWLEMSQEKSKMEQKLRKLQLDTDSLNRSRDKISSQLDATVRELKQLSAKLERAEALLNARGENSSTASNGPASESSGRFGGEEYRDAGEKHAECSQLDVNLEQSESAVDGDLQHFFQKTADDNYKLKEENRTLLETISAYEERLKFYGGTFDDRRGEGFASKLIPRSLRPGGTEDPFRRIGALQYEVDSLRADLDKATRAASENKRRFKEYADLLDIEKGVTSKQHRRIEELISNLSKLEREKGDAERKCARLTRDLEHMGSRLQKTGEELASVEAVKNDIAK